MPYSILSSGLNIVLIEQSAEDNFVVGVEVAVRPDRAAGKLRQQPNSKRGTTCMLSTKSMVSLTQARNSSKVSYYMIGKLTMVGKCVQSPLSTCCVCASTCWTG